MPLPHLSPDSLQKSLEPWSNTEVGASFSSVLIATPFSAMVPATSATISARGVAAALVGKRKQICLAWMWDRRGKGDAEPYGTAEAKKEAQKGRGFCCKRDLGFFFVFFNFWRGILVLKKKKLRWSMPHQPFVKCL